MRRASDDGTEAGDDSIAVLDEHLKTAKRHPAGTTDRLLQADRERPLTAARPLIEAPGA